MATFRKLEPSELEEKVPYRNELAEFAVGDIVGVTLEKGERGSVVRSLIVRALKTLGRTCLFQRNPKHSVIIFSILDSHEGTGYKKPKLGETDVFAVAYREKFTELRNGGTEQSVAHRKALQYAQNERARLAEPQEPTTETET